MWAGHCFWVLGSLHSAPSPWPEAFYEWVLSPVPPSFLCLLCSLGPRSTLVVQIARATEMTSDFVHTTAAAVIGKVG